MRTKPKKLNVRLLRRIQKWIKDEPRRFRVTWWARRGKKEMIECQPVPPCNTTACIAGSALFLSGVKKINNATARYKASRLLGISEEESASLFLFDNWPPQFKQHYSPESEMIFANELTLRDVKKNAGIAIKRIDHFIKYRQ